VISCSTGIIVERPRTGTISWISRTALFGEHPRTAGIISHSRGAIITCAPQPVVVGDLILLEDGGVILTEDGSNFEQG